MDASDAQREGPLAVLDLVVAQNDERFQSEGRSGIADLSDPVACGGSAYSRSFSRSPLALTRSNLPGPARGVGETTERVRAVSLRAVVTEWVTSDQGEKERHLHDGHGTLNLFRPLMTTATIRRDGDSISQGPRHFHDGRVGVA